MREPDACVVDLARSRLAAELMHDLDDLPERRRAQRLALRQQSAARIHHRARLREELRLVARCAEFELLVREQLPRGISVLAFDDIEVVGTDPGLGVCVARGDI